MKKIGKLLAIFLLVLGACKTETKDAKQELANYDTFGEKINLENTLTKEEMLAKFNDLQPGDTLNIKFASSINDVCSKKGCWMKLPLDNEKETMVRFKDYGFFMPLNSAGREVVVEGKAFVKETSVDELRHYAEDAGKSEEEIAQITEPKKEFSFEAHGVLMKQ